jgi:hypothetical protein
MPEPIMLPMTKAIALVRPIPLTNSCVRGVPSDTVCVPLVTNAFNPEM